MELTINLPKPHAKQAEFMRSPARRKVIVAGRRGGKTTAAAALAVEAMLKGRRVLEAAPTADQTNAFWDSCKKFLREPIAAGVVYKNESQRILEIDGGGRIRTKTAWDADSLRGDYADLLILDEFSLMEPSAWDEVGAPMLLDNDGDAIFIFTPKRRNHAYMHYLKAKGDDTGRWAKWEFTSYDNPHLSKPALDEITADMTEDAYKQEILAEFLEGQGVVFRNIYACLHAPLDPSYDEHPRHRIVAGLDWGKENDYTVISVGCATCKKELARDRFNKIDYIFQRGRLVILLDRWRVSIVLPERNSAGEPIIEQLIRDGVPVMNGHDDKPGFYTGPSTKSPLIENLALAFERTEWQFQANDVWTAELEAYERKVSTVTGRSQYSAPEGMHDDTVMARALMLWAAGNSAPLPDRQPEQPNKWAKFNDAPEDSGRWRGRF